MSVLSKLRRVAVLGAIAIALLVPAAMLSAQAPKAHPQAAPKPWLVAPSGEPDAIRDAKALRASLSAQQLKQVRASLQRYSADVAALASQLPAISQAVQPASTQRLAEQDATAGNQLNGDIAPPADGFVPDPGVGQAALDQQQASFQTAQHTNAQLKALLGTIEQDITAVLTPDQLKLHQSATHPTQAEKPVNANPEAFQRDATLQYTSSYCYNAAQFSALGRYYSYFAYYYAYYDYVYGTGTSNAYNAYYYLNYGQSYALSGHLNTSAGFFNVNTLNYDLDSLVSSGYIYEYNAAMYDYYGWNYALTDYQNTGNSYAYNAYLYGYYAYYYTYNSYTNGATCYSS
ncbi:MAG TPA: hypothetical protein PKK78_21295 [Kouleothrix sp.]|nr:hypothetical protein [Kouleothrix sp.]